MKSLATVAALLFVASAIPVGAQDPGGCWLGQDGDGVALLELGRTAGGWGGSVHVLSARVVSQPLDSARVEGTSVRVRGPWGEEQQPAELSATLSGDSLTGTLRIGTDERAVALSRVDAAQQAPARELVGYWSGGLEQNGAVVLRLGLEIGEAPCGQVIATLDSPDQGVADLPIAGMRLTGDSLRFGVPSVRGSFAGEVDAQRTHIQGRWSQSGASLSMSLARGDSALAWRRPQHPTPPFPYTSTEVTYRNPDDGTTLAGTLTLPPGEGPFPAVILLTGSGAQDRDETLMGHKPFLVIADYLTRRGIAVLRVDDRGVGGSSGNVMSATIDDNVGDAAAGIEYLRAHPRIDADRVGVVGHSEGGWVAPVLANRSDALSFVVMLAGPAVPPYDLLLAQSRLMLEVSGDTLVEEQVSLTRRMLDILRSEPDSARAVAQMRAAFNEWLAALPPGATELRARSESPQGRAQLEQSLVVQTTPWFRGLLAFDPRPSLEALDVPVLALYGELDRQVPPSQSVPVLEEIWADHPDATVRVMPGLNHLFQPARTGLVVEYSQIEETFSPAALEVIGDWIEERFGR